MKILKEIKEILDAKLTNLEYLESKKRSEVSLGVIKPKIIDMIWVDVKEHKKIDNAIKQMTLDNKSALKIEKMDKRFRYVFKCSDSCQTTHKIMCEDWELGELYRKMRKKYDEEEACYKVKEKFVDYMNSLENVYFIVGRHAKPMYKSWLVISVLYPKKDELRNLKTMSLDIWLK